MRLVIAILLLWASSAWGVVTINSGTSFPYNATIAGETYRLSENISCPTTCIVVSGAADNATIDLNGHTMTFGTANAVTVPNADFENWTGSTPDNWTVLSGSVDKSTAVKYGVYDLLSTTAAFKIRSSAFSINGGQTYNAWILAKAGTGAAGTLRILSAADDTVLASFPMGHNSNEAVFNDFAATRGEEGGAFKYKPAGTTSVKLEFESDGGYIFRVAEIGMSPADHYGIVVYGYQNTALFPDISGMTFGYADNVTVQNGTITQGGGNASYASALFNEGGVAGNTGWIVSGVTVNISGPNSGGIYGFKSITNTTVNSSVTRIFNRKYASKAATVTGPLRYTTALTIDNLTANNFPIYGVIANKCPSSGGENSSIEIKNSSFKNKGVVTEPYAMSFSGTKNINIHNNTINPNGDIGRGILVDAVGCSDVDEGVTGNIYENTFLNIYEEANYEYPATSLEAVGIRIRNWGGAGEGHKLNVYSNTFNYTNRENGTHAIYGININAFSINDELDIYNNTITVNSHPSTQWAAGISLQGVGNASTVRHKIRNNAVTSNSYAIGFDGNDGANTTNLSIYSNILTASVAPIRFGMWTYSGTDSDIDIYCNQITNDGAAGYPFYFNGTLSDINVDYNQITNSNSSGHEVWADSNESTDILFFGSGTIDVTGGGSVGAAVAATNGSAGCYTTAGPTGGDLSTPFITITSPTTASTYDNGSVATISLGGTASDNVAVSSVAWTCATCTPTSGSATGTTTWSFGPVTLSNGANNVVVTAMDSSANTGSDSISVTYTVPTASGGVLKKLSGQVWKFNDGRVLKTQ